MRLVGTMIGSTNAPHSNVAVSDVTDTGADAVAEDVSTPGPVAVADVNSTGVTGKVMETTSIATPPQQKSLLGVSNVHVSAPRTAADVVWTAKGSAQAQWVRGNTLITLSSSSVNGYDVTTGRSVFGSVRGPTDASRMAVGERTFATATRAQDGRLSVDMYDQATGALVWQRTIDDQTKDESLVLAHGKVFVRSQKTLTVLDERDGAKLWSLPAEPTYYVDVHVVGKQVIFAREDGWVASHDRDTGKQLWATQLPDTSTPEITCDGEQVIALVGHKSIKRPFVLGSDGTIQWKLDEHVISDASSLVGKWVQLRYTDSRYAFFDRTTGKPGWEAGKNGFETDGEVLVSPDFVDNQPYPLVARKVETGEPLWQLQLRAKEFGSCMIRGKDTFVKTAYYPSNGPPEYALRVLDTQTGKERLNVILPSRPFTELVAIKDDHVVLQNQDGLYGVRLPRADVKPWQRG